MSLFLTTEQLEKLTTPRLLAYKNRIMKYPETPNWEGEDGMNKTNSEWKQAYADVKSVLSKRENVEKKK